MPQLRLNYNPKEDSARPIASVEYPPGHTIVSVGVTVIDLSTGTTVAATASATVAAADSNVFLYDTAGVTGIDFDQVENAQLKIVFTPDAPSGQPPSYVEVEVNSVPRIVLNATYDDQTTTIQVATWLLRGGSVVTVPTGVTVTWRNQDGTQLFQETSNTPDAQGVFSITKVQTLVDNEAYYVDIDITDVLGTVSQRRGISHQA